MILVESMKSDD